MNALKGLGNGILSFLLLLSLSVFGVAFLINSTLLNPDFVAGRIDKLNMNELARDYIDEQISEDLTQEEEFLKEALSDVITDQEPWLKEQLNSTVYAGYDYLLGKSERLEIYIPFKKDVLFIPAKDNTIAWRIILSDNTCDGIGIELSNPPWNYSEIIESVRVTSES